MSHRLDRCGCCIAKRVSMKAFQFFIASFVLLLSSCVDSGWPTHTESNSGGGSSTTTGVAAIILDVEEVDVEVAIASETPEPAVEVGLYDGHANWCEWVHRPLCGKQKRRNPKTRRMEHLNHGECGTDHRGVQLKCARPYWASTDDPKRCAPPFPKKGEQTWRKERLRFLVGRLYGLDGEWWVNANTKHTSKWAHRFYRLMVMVAGRETSMRTWKSHNMSEDVEGASNAYYRHAKLGTYAGNEHFTGFRVLAGPGTRAGEFVFEEIVHVEKRLDAKDIEAEILGRHPEWITTIQMNSDRWRSFGYAGQTTAGWIMEVDKMAPPEVLCLEAFSLETYVNRIRRTQRKLPRSYDCKDAKGKKYVQWMLNSGKQKKDKVKETRRDPTWHVLHRAASGGSMCPGESAEWLQTHTGFAKRARAHRLDPDQIVKANQLPTKKTPEELMVMTEEVSDIYCATYEEWVHKQTTGECV